jgi:hypothetical protein
VASLKSPDWLVDIFRHHLNASSWPPLDKAQGQPIGCGSSRKWVRDQGKLELRIPQVKSPMVVGHIEGCEWLRMMKRVTNALIR